MAKTTAERQRSYRQARPTAGPDGNGEHRLDLYVSTATRQALARLASCYGVTKREMLERLLQAEDQRQIDSLKDDDEGFAKYMNVTR